jgi:hypothetical protein
MLADVISARHSALRREKRALLLAERRGLLRRKAENPLDADFGDGAKRDCDGRTDLAADESCFDAAMGLGADELLDIRQRISAELGLNLADDTTIALLLEIESQVASEELAALGAPVEPDWEEYFLHLSV